VQSTVDSVDIGLEDIWQKLVSDGCVLVFLCTRRRRRDRRGGDNGRGHGDATALTNVHHFVHSALRTPHSHFLILSSALPLRHTSLEKADRMDDGR
jgi:hypothetical protein